MQLYILKGPSVCLPETRHNILWDQSVVFTHWKFFFNYLDQCLKKPMPATDYHKVLLTLFQTYCSGTYLCFPAVPFQCNNLFNPWLLCYRTMIETMVSSKREMNPVPMTIINPQKGIYTAMD